MGTQNHLGLTGISFVEFSSQEKNMLKTIFHRFGFNETFCHKSEPVSLFQQGHINILINEKKDGFAYEFRSVHGPSLPSMGWKVLDPKVALAKAIERGAKPVPSSIKKDYDLDAIMGIGDSLIYFVPESRKDHIFSDLGLTVKVEDRHVGLGFQDIDHLTNNVPSGTMGHWSQFYKHVFGFEEIRYFDIRGIKTGLTSFALKSPCGTFSIPINEGTEEKSQINEYLRDYKGSGVQHLAFTTQDMIQTVQKLQKSGIQTLDIDDEYYAHVFQKIPIVSENHLTLRELNILVDGDHEGYLLQIFTKNIIGPIFIEVIQRKNHFSFGEGNFGALFRSIEKDQERRGVI